MLQQALQKLLARVEKIRVWHTFSRSIADMWCQEFEETYLN